MLIPWWLAALLAALLSNYALHKANADEPVKNAECKVACQYMGYDSGSFKAEECLCVDEKDYKSTVERKIIVLNSKRKAKESN